MRRLAEKHDHLDLFNVRQHFGPSFCLLLYTSLYCTALLVLLTFLLMMCTMRGYG